MSSINPKRNSSSVRFNVLTRRQQRQRRYQLQINQYMIQLQQAESRFVLNGGFM